MTGASATPGSTKVLKRSPNVTAPSRSRPTRAAPISTMRSFAGSNPVVSRSSETSSIRVAF